MSKDDATESLLILVGELLYKNQLLREAIASKDNVIELIINHLTNTAESPCKCGLTRHLAFVRNTVKEYEVELLRRKMYSFNEFSCIAKYLIDSAPSFSYDAANRATEK